MFSLEEKTALREYRAAHGRMWKRKLAADWERSAAGAVLQSVRNRIGNRGLADLRSEQIAETGYRSWVAEYWRIDGGYVGGTAQRVIVSHHWHREADAASYLENALAIRNYLDEPADNAGPRFAGRVVLTDQPAEGIYHCERAQLEQGPDGRCTCGHIVTADDCRAASRAVFADRHRVSV